MKGKLETIMIQNKAFSTQSSFAANADYRSEAELLQDYPKQEVENIKKKALSFEHPTRGCIVYQDVCFNASREDYTPTIDPCMHEGFLYIVCAVPPHAYLQSAVHCSFLVFK